MINELDLTKGKNYICTIEGEAFDGDFDPVKLGLTLSDAIKARDFLIEVINENTEDSIKETI